MKREWFWKINANHPYIDNGRICAGREERVVKQVIDSYRGEEMKNRGSFCNYRKLALEALKHVHFVREIN